jgi:hypothetical protein
MRAAQRWTCLRVRKSSCGHTAPNLPGSAAREEVPTIREERRSPPSANRVESLGCIFRVWDDLVGGDERVRPSRTVRLVASRPACRGTRFPIRLSNADHGEREHPAVRRGHPRRKPHQRPGPRLRRPCRRPAREGGPVPGPPAGVRSAPGGLGAPPIASGPPAPRSGGLGGDQPGRHAAPSGEAGGHLTGGASR